MGCLWPYLCLHLPLELTGQGPFGDLFIGWSGGVLCYKSLLWPYGLPVARVLSATLPYLYNIEEKEKGVRKHVSRCINKRSKHRLRLHWFDRQFPQLDIWEPVVGIPLLTTNILVEFQKSSYTTCGTRVIRTQYLCQWWTTLGWWQLTRTWTSSAGILNKVCLAVGLSGIYMI